MTLTFIILTGKKIRASTIDNILKKK